MSTPEQPEHTPPSTGGAAVPGPMPPSSGQPAYPPPGYPPAAYAGAPPGMYVDPSSGLMLPDGVQLAGVGRRIGAFFLAFPLVLVTLGIGYFIWGLVVWGQGTSPALQVLGMRCWVPDNRRRAGFWRMVLRDVVGGFVQGILSVVTLLVSFILFLAQKDHRTLADLVGGTVVVHDPGKVLR